MHNAKWRSSTFFTFVFLVTLVFAVLGSTCIIEQGKYFHTRMNDKDVETVSYGGNESNINGTILVWFNQTTTESKHYERDPTMVGVLLMIAGVIFLILAITGLCVIVIGGGLWIIDGVDCSHVSKDDSEDD